MQRIMIIGGPGSGKSTLARALGAKLGLPVVHIDPMFWEPGWVQRDKELTRSLIEAAALKDDWVFEGNSPVNYALRAERADMIVFLDLPRPLRLWRIIKRRVMFHGRTRPEMPANCLERLDHAFLAEVWTWDRRTRPKAMALLAQMAGPTRILRLGSTSQVRRFLTEPAAK